MARDAVPSNKGMACRILDWAEKNEVLLCAYLALEEALGERLVEVNPGFVAVVPYWAVWPFEVMILPRRHITQLQEMTDTE